MELTMIKCVCTCLSISVFTMKQETRRAYGTAVSNFLYSFQSHQKNRPCSQALVKFHLESAEITGGVHHPAKTCNLQPSSFRGEWGLHCLEIRNLPRGTFVHHVPIA